MKNFLTASVAALALLLMTGMGVHASPLPPGTVSWSYNFSPGAPAIFADGNPSAGVTFSNEVTKTTSASSTDIAAANLSTFSTSLAGNPDKLTTHGAYSLSVLLSTTDLGGLHSQLLTFTGKLSGTFSSESSNITNVFGPNTVQTAHLGAYTFTVSLTTYTAPGIAGQSQVGAIGTHVEVSSLAPTSLTPEPGTMLLSGFGLSFLGGAAWRKRRQARVNVAV